MKNLLQKVPCLALVALLCAFVSCTKEDGLSGSVNSEWLDFTSKAPGEFAKLDRYRYVHIDSLIIRGRMDDQDFRQLWWLIRYGRLSSINLENAEPVDENSVVFEQTEKYTSLLHVIILPKHLKKIPAKAFRGCYTLKNVVLPQGYESIGDSAFYGCENIRSLQIPSMCLSIGRYAFGECKKLSDMSIPSNLKKIPDGMFYECDSIKRIDIPAGVTEIGKEAFAGTGVERIELPKEIKKIADGTFNGCHSLKKITIPAGVTEIGKEAFEGTGLEEIDLPKGLKEIADYTFSGCHSLKEITIPDGVEWIGEGAFGHAGLERIHMPKNLKYIGPFAFRNLHKLEELILPSSLKTIEGGAFVRLTSLKRIYCLAVTPPKCGTTELVVGDRHNPVRVPVFEWTVWPYEDNPSRDIPVYVPNGSAYRYMCANGWSYFQNFIGTDEFPEL